MFQSILKFFKTLKKSFFQDLIIVPFLILLGIVTLAIFKNTKRIDFIHEENIKKVEKIEKKFDIYQTEKQKEIDKLYKDLEKIKTDEKEELKKIKEEYEMIFLDLEVSKDAIDMNTKARTVKEKEERFYISCKNECIIQCNENEVDCSVCQTIKIPTEEELTIDKLELDFYNILNSTEEN